MEEQESRTELLVTELHGNGFNETETIRVTLFFPHHCLVDDIVELFYPQLTMRAARGSSVRLSCEARYDYKRCGEVHVSWFQGDSELTNPQKHVTTVNETIASGTVRRRQVVTEILDLQPEDSESFQCKASCNNEVTAMGHFIRLIVIGG